MPFTRPNHLNSSSVAFVRMNPSIVAMSRRTSALFLRKSPSKSIGSMPSWYTSAAPASAFLSALA